MTPFTSSAHWQLHERLFITGWRCSCCHAPIEPVDQHWRWSGRYYEHQCPGNHAFAEHQPAERVVENTEQE